MKRHIEDYNNAHHIPYKPDDSLLPTTEKEFEVYLNAHDIYEADFAIAQSYEFVPDSTNDRLRQDLTEYFSMQECYHAFKQENSFKNKVLEKYTNLRGKITKRQGNSSIECGTIRTRRKTNSKERGSNSGMDIG